MRTRQAASLALAGALLSGCSGGLPHPDTSSVHVELTTQPFYRHLTTLPPSDLRQAYGDYFDAFCQRELRIGRPGEPGFEQRLAQFVQCPENSEVLPACDSAFQRLRIDAEATDAFDCFRALFPTDPAPTKLLCHFCGFNDRILVDSSYVSFAIEHYLGPDCRFYAWLDMPQYARQNKTPDAIVPDLVKAWLYANHPEQSQRDDILSALLYQGRVLYAAHRCLPDRPLEDILALTGEQLHWCQVNEARMWACLAERKLLYSTDMLDRAKIVNEAPFTSFFGNASPGRAATYCAYQIARRYAERHPKRPLPDLLDDPDAQAILQGSQYNP